MVEVLKPSSDSPFDGLPYLTVEKMFVFWPEIFARLMVNIFSGVTNVKFRRILISHIGDIIIEYHTTYIPSLFDEWTTGKYKRPRAFTLTKVLLMTLTKARLCHVDR